MKSSPSFRYGGYAFQNPSFPRKSGSPESTPIPAPAPTRIASAERIASAAALATSSIADVLRIHALGLGNVLGAADHGAAIGKHRDVVTADRRPHEIFVAAHLSYRREFRLKLIEWHCRSPGKAELYGVAAAQHCRVASPFARQPWKLPPAATRAIGRAGRVHLDLPRRAVPQIEDRPRPADCVGVSAQDLQCLVGLERPDHPDDR